MSDLILPPASPSDKRVYTLFPSTAVVQKSELGTPNIRTSTSHKCYKFRDQRYWAEGGRIYIVNDKDGEFTTCSIDEFGLRALGLARQARKMFEMRLWIDEANELVRTIGDMKECIYEAKAQGDPHDPNVLMYKLRQRGKRVSLGGMKGHHVKSGPISGRIIGKGNDFGRMKVE